jgi:hypothetical protein
MKLTGESRSTRRSVPVPLCPHKFYMDRPGIEQDLCGERPATNRLSHGTFVRFCGFSYLGVKSN